MDQGTDLMPSSPSNSSLSSSDLDTESTASFFPDRSTTLGTLMGVTFAATAANIRPNPAARSTPCDGDAFRARATMAAAAQQRQQRWRWQRRGRSGWWRLCRDESLSRPKSLREFLQAERRMAEAGEVADGHFVCGGGDGIAPPEHEAVGGGPLFSEGRVIPPAPPTPTEFRQRRRSESVGRLPALLIAGICSGGEG